VLDRGDELGERRFAREARRRTCLHAREHVLLGLGHRAGDHLRGRERIDQGRDRSTAIVGADIQQDDVRSGARVLREALVYARRRADDLELLLPLEQLEEAGAVQADIGDEEDADQRQVGTSLRRECACSSLPRGTHAPQRAGACSIEPPVAVTASRRKSITVCWGRVKLGT
jgi:hypothetical protein